MDTPWYSNLISGKYMKMEQMLQVKHDNAIEMIQAWLLELG